MIGGYFYAMSSITFSALAGRFSASALLGGLSRCLTSPWAIILAVALAFLLNAHSLPLSDVDEGAFSEATREMLARGNLVSPTLNGEARHDKPILIYWLQAAAVYVLGVDEFSFRLPSILAALAWVVVLYRFVARQEERSTAVVSVLAMVLSLQVGFIAKAAIADALLNLFICLALFAIYDLFLAGRKGLGTTAIRRQQCLIYLALGLGFLTKGPVAVFLPLVIGSLFFISAGAWREALRTAFFLPGWVIFLSIVLPWHVMVFLDQGDAFFRGFYLQHNLNRYASTFEGHGGNPFYYLLVLPLVLMPFSGWLLAIAGRLLAGLKRADEAALFERFLMCWFAVVLAFFSFSRTQLPHYLLYGCTPLFILLARHRQIDKQRLLAFLPVVLWGLLLAALPWIFERLAGHLTRPLEIILLDGLTAAFARPASWLLALFALLVLAISVWRRLPVWQGLVLIGLLQAGLVFGVIAPCVLSVTQGPVRDAGELARSMGEPVLAYKFNQPSFSVYRQAITPARVPGAGELVITRRDRLDSLAQEVAPLGVTEVYQRGFVSLLRVGESIAHE